MGALLSRVTSFANIGVDYVDLRRGVVVREYWLARVARLRPLPLRGV